MAISKRERVVNLLFCLLAAEEPLTRERIREANEAYLTMTPQNFDRHFERDKNELRAQGVPIEVTELAVGGQGYRVRREDYVLEPLDVDGLDAALLGLAAMAWSRAEGSSGVQRALAKLRTAGLADPDADATAAFGGSPLPEEPALRPVLEGVTEHKLLRFAHRRREGGEIAERTLEPWGLTTHRGRWYVVGHDRDRDATRWFKLARIVGPVRVGPETVEVPEVDMAEWSTRLSTSAPVDETAVVALRPGGAAGLRRLVRAGVEAPADVVVPEGFEVVEVGVPAGGLVAEVAAAGADAVVLAPASLREDVRRHLAGVAALAVGA